MTTTGAGYRQLRSSRFPGVLWTDLRPAGAVRVLPDACMDIIWDGRRLFVAGADTTRATCISEASTYVAVRADPGVLPTVLGCPAAELTDRRIDLADVWTAARARRCNEIVGASADPSDALETIVVQQLWRNSGPPAATRLADLAAGGLSVTDMADVFGVTDRHLRRISLHHFGYSPKTLQRVLRVRTAMADLAAGSRLSDVAARAGYSDYPHMYREFLAITGSRPTDIV